MIDGWKLAGVSAIALAIASTHAAAQEFPLPGQTPQLVVQMVFGQTWHGGEPISRRAWDRFVADTVTPALPDGFIVTEGYGQWRDPVSHAIGRERTAILLVAAPDSPALRARLAAIADTYRRRFAQRSVGLISTTGCAAF